MLHNKEIKSVVFWWCSQWARYVIIKMKDTYKISFVNASVWKILEEMIRWCDEQSEEKCSEDVKYCKTGDMKAVPYSLYNLTIQLV